MSNALDETLDARILRLLNTRLDEKFFQNAGTKPMVTRALHVCSWFRPYEERDIKRALELHGVLCLETIDDLMRLSVKDIEGVPYSGSKTVELMGRAFDHLMMAEFGISMPLFKSENERYKNPRGVIYNFIANPDNQVGAKLSINFNLASFARENEHKLSFSTETSIGDEYAHVMIDHNTHEQTENEFDLTVTYMRETHQQSSAHGTARCTVDGCNFTVNRTGNNFRLDIVQRLG